MASVRQRKNGWQVLYRDPTGKQCGKQFKGRREAERFAHRVEVAKEKGEYRDPKAGKRLFGEVADIWFAGKSDLAPGTISNYEMALRLHVLPTFKNKPVASINPEHVAAWVGEAKAKGTGGTALAKAYVVLEAVMRTAVSLRWIASSPVLPDFRPRMPKAPEARFLTREQVRDLAEAIGEWWAPLIWTAADSGMRQSELFGLKVGRVDLLRRTVQVAEALTDVRGTLIVGPPKSKAGRRTIPLTRHVCELLTPLLVGKSPGDLVFCSRHGGPVRSSNFHSGTWTPALKKAGLEGVRFHSLRHTHCAWLIAAGVPALEISRRLGHEQVGFTLAKYGHLFSGAEQAANALDAMHDAMKPEGTVTLLHQAQ